MRFRRPTLIVLVSLLLHLLPAAICGAQQDNDPEADKPKKKNWTEAVQESSKRVDVFADAKANKPLQMIAAYKWSNPARPRVVGERLCLLYLHEGRPVASCKVYPTGKLIVHAFHSFTELQLAAKHDGELLWSPPPSPPKLMKLKDADPPASTAGRRRLQMRSLVREFAAETGPGEAKRQSTVPELRLLPRPLYRYQVKDEGQQGVVDGAVFCFVANGGNPQVLVMVEAVREGDSLHWQCGFSRRTLARLKVLHKEKEVWSVPFVANPRLNSTTEFYKVDFPATE